MEQEDLLTRIARKFEETDEKIERLKSWVDERENNDAKEESERSE